MTTLQAVQGQLSEHRALDIATLATTHCCQPCPGPGDHSVGPGQTTLSSPARPATPTGPEETPFSPRAALRAWSGIPAGEGAASRPELRDPDGTRQGLVLGSQTSCWLSNDGQLAPGCGDLRGPAEAGGGGLRRVKLGQREKVTERERPSRGGGAGNGRKGGETGEGRQ